MEVEKAVTMGGGRADRRLADKWGGGGQAAGRGVLVIATMRGRGEGGAHHSLTEEPEGEENHAEI